MASNSPDALEVLPEELQGLLKEVKVLPGAPGPAEGIARTAGAASGLLRSKLQDFLKAFKVCCRDLTDGVNRAESG